MPHATKKSTMGESINGDTSFKTLSHLKAYPVVSDSVEAFKSNSYGAKSLNIADTVHNKIVAPTYPYLKTPYSYVSPYVNKADELSDTILTKVDSKFPVVKTETKEIKDTAVGYAYYPYHKFDEGKQYVFKTYDGEYKKCGGDGVVAGVKALITSSLIVFSDSLTYAGSFFNQTKEQAKEVSKEKSSN